MSNLYTVRTVATHQRKTAKQILASAKICQMMAGNYEIVATLHGFEEMILARTNSGLLALGGLDGAICTMELDADDAARLDALEDAIEESYARGETVQPQQ